MVLCLQPGCDDIQWEIDKREFDEMKATLKKTPPDLVVGVREGWALSSCLTRTKHALEVGAVPTHFYASRTVFIPDDTGRIVRSPDALRPLTLCNCDCKMITTAICFGLQRYTIICMHLAQRCISSKQMTDNIFEEETTAVAHVACAPQESGILLTDFAASYSSVNHSWIFHVLEKTEFPRFSCRFLQSIYLHRMTEVEFARKTRGHFCMARGVRHGCPASRYSFATAVDPIFRWSRTRPF